MGGHRFENVPLEDGEGASLRGCLALARGSRARHPGRPAGIRHARCPPPAHGRSRQPGRSTRGPRARHPDRLHARPGPARPDRGRRAPWHARPRDLRDERTRRRRSGTACGSWHGWPTRPTSWSSSPDRTWPRQLADLVGIDLSAGPPRHTVVAEGVDTASGRCVCVGARRRHERSGPGRPGARHRAPAWASTRAAHRRERRATPRGQGHGSHRRGLRPRHVPRRALRTSSSSAAISTTRPPARPPSWLASTRSSAGMRASATGSILLGHRRHAEAGLVLAVARHGRDGLHRARWRLRLWQPQGGVRPRHPRGHGGGPARRGAADRRPCHLRRAWRHRRARGHDRPAGHRGRHPRGAAPRHRPGDGRAHPRRSWRPASRSSRMARTLAAVYRIAAGASTLALTVEEGRAA